MWYFVQNIDVPYLLTELIVETCERLNIEMMEMEIMPDHVPLPMEVDPQYRIHKAVKQIKGYSSRILREEFIKKSSYL